MSNMLRLALEARMSQVKQLQTELAAKDAEIAALKKIIMDVRGGNYDNAHDITAARRFLFEQWEILYPKSGQE